MVAKGKRALWAAAFLTTLLSLAAYWLSTRFQALAGQQLFPWQVDRGHALLLVASVWFLFLALGFVLVTFQRSFIRFPIVRLDARLSARILAVLILAYIVAYGWLALARHASFNSTGYDLAINEQVIWNTLHGRFFASSLEVDNYFGDHFQPILVATLPIYGLAQRPETLLILQTLALASGAVPLYLLARRKLKSELMALAFAAVYLLYPSIGFVNRFDFHTGALAIPAFIGAYAAIEHDRWKWASLLLLVALLTKENMGLSVALFGLYALLWRRRRAFGLAWILVGLTTFGVTSFWLIPAVRGEPSDTLARYHWLGDSVPQMANSLVADPSSLWRMITGPGRQLYLLQLLVPVGFLSVVGLPELLPAASGLGLNLLAEHHCQPTIYCQYTTPVAPFVLVAAVYGLARLKSIGAAPLLRFVAVALVLMALASWQIDNPFTESTALPPPLSEPGNADIVRMALTSVPPEGSLVTTNDYAPHLARRQELYILGLPSQRTAPLDPEIVFLNLYDQEYILCEGIREYIAGLDISRYGVTFRTGGVIVIQAGAGSNELFRDFVLNWNNCAG